jgi:hypothetical protein
MTRLLKTTDGKSFHFIKEVSRMQEKNGKRSAKTLIIPLPDDGNGWVNPPGYNSHKLYNEVEHSFKGEDNATELALEEMSKLAESGKTMGTFCRLDLSSYSI